MWAFAELQLKKENSQRQPMNDVDSIALILFKQTRLNTQGGSRNIASLVVLSLVQAAEPLFPRNNCQAQYCDICKVFFFFFTQHQTFRTELNQSSFRKRTDFWSWRCGFDAVAGSTGEDWTDQITLN